MTKIYKLGRIGSETTRPSDVAWAEDLKELVSNLPADIIDRGPGNITRMTQGQFNRWMEAERFKNLAIHAGGHRDLEETERILRTNDRRAISTLPGDLAQNLIRFYNATDKMNKPAFTRPIVKVAGAAIGAPVWQEVGDWFDNAFDSVMNWLFKEAIPVAAPFFMYVFNDDPRLKGKVLIKKNKQINVLKWIATTTGQSYDQLKAMTKSALYAKLGQSPTDYWTLFMQKMFPYQTKTPITPEQIQDAADVKTKTGDSTAAQNSVKTKTGGGIGAGPGMDNDFGPEDPYDTSGGGTKDGKPPVPGTTAPGSDEDWTKAKTAIDAIAVALAPATGGISLAVPVVLEIVTAVAKLFKKPGTAAGKDDTVDASGNDWWDLVQDFFGIGNGTNQDGTTGAGSGGGSNNALLIGGGLGGLVILYFLFKKSD